MKRYHSLITALACCYCLLGSVHGGETNPATAEFEALLDQATKERDAHAQYRLGICYSKGEGVVKDDKEAVKWYVRATDRDYYPALKELEKCYRSGKGVEADAAEVRRCQLKRAELMSPKSVPTLITGEEFARSSKIFTKSGSLNFTVAQLTRIVADPTYILTDVKERKADLISIGDYICSQLKKSRALVMLPNSKLHIAVVHRNSNTEGSSGRSVVLNGNIWAIVGGSGGGGSQTCVLISLPPPSRHAITRISVCGSSFIRNEGCTQVERFTQHEKPAADDAVRKLEEALLRTLSSWRQTDGWKGPQYKEALEKARKMEPEAQILTKGIFQVFTGNSLRCYSRRFTIVSLRRNLMAPDSYEGNSSKIQHLQYVEVGQSWLPYDEDEKKHLLNLYRKTYALLAKSASFAEYCRRVKDVDVHISFSHWPESVGVSLTCESFERRFPDIMVNDQSHLAQKQSKSFGNFRKLDEQALAVAVKELEAKLANMAKE